MSKGYRNGAFALGLVVGGGIVLNLVLWLDYQAKQQCQNDSSNCQHEHDSKIGDWWDSILGTFISPSDTLAQWVMAFFTIAATGVLVLTLRSANKTNIAAVKASEAALEANQIMRDEKRPWVTLIRDVDCDYFERGQWGFSVAWNHNFENLGKSPAHNIRLRAKAIRVDHLTGLGRELEAFVEDRENRTDTVDETILFPQQRTDYWRYFSTTSVNFTPNKQDVFGEHTILLICLTYQLGPSADSKIGVEGRVMGFVEKNDAIGPFGHEMLEYSNFRIVR